MPILIGLLQLVPVETVQAQDEHKQVLVLYSTRRDSEFSTIGERDLPRLLDAGLGRHLDYYSEFLDTARFPDPSYQVGFSDFLRVKYRGVRFDLVIALQDVAFEFLNRNRDSLFPDTPEVFLANHRVTAGPNSTGLIQERNLTATLALIETLQPDVRSVFVVTGAARADKALENALRTQAQSFRSRLTVNYLSSLPTTELERRLARLPDHSVVYYLLVTEDGAGNKYHPLDYVNRVAAAANVPTYSWVDSTMGRGIIGGNLYSQTEAVRRTAEVALRVLRGEQPDRIDASAIDLNSSQVDWRQLQRWKIDEALVPPGTMVRFREDSIWNRFRPYILSGLVLLFVQSGLIAGLLIQRRRRRHAEIDLRQSQQHLRASYERIRELAARLLRAQETERSRIARELHDDINQRIALLTMELELIGAADGGNIKRLADAAVVRSQEIGRSVHELSHSLHPAMLQLVGLVAALQALCRELSHAGIPVTFTHDRIPETLSPDVTLCVFRVVQETLQNAIKYSKSREIAVHLAGMLPGLTLTVVDDGVGFDVGQVWASGLGLVSIKERVEAIGGTLEVRSSPGAGTRVEATIPSEVAESSDAIVAGLGNQEWSPADQSWV